MTAMEWDAAHTGRSLRKPTDADDKYSRGVVGIRTGSTAYPGAAVLGVEAAWRTGTGMVRYVGPRRAEDLVLARRPETVTEPGRVQAWVIGSGTDAAARDDDETAALRALLSGPAPVVVDAGALDLAVDAAAPVVVTPHRREFDRVRAGWGIAALAADASDEARADAVRDVAARLGAAVLLKGAVTIVADPEGAVRFVRAGTPWLATAGTGDVLAGAMGAVVAARAADGALDAAALADAAAAAAWLHGRAGVAAASARGGSGGPVTALDVAGMLPGIVADVLALAGR
ncbi:ADP/ATP-dependent (S)-NAD(P)H-hydrate dehydratase [Microbacterium sp. NPDC089189]|uniref:ADP-dependent NAD(P)H-hydrate dehydratase n=1 Tax=Microbacterium sp. NPDC089189 TaxID=3154972 RepID=UPI00343B0559